VNYKWDFDFHSYGHQKYILYKKFYEKDEEEDECHECDEEDNDKCYKKVYYRICYYKHNHKRVSEHTNLAEAGMLCCISCRNGDFCAGAF
jgi:hypothetical protein